MKDLAIAAVFLGCAGFFADVIAISRQRYGIENEGTPAVLELVMSVFMLFRWLLFAVCVVFGFTLSGWSGAIAIVGVSFFSGLFFRFLLFWFPPPIGLPFAVLGACVFLIRAFL